MGAANDGVRFGRENFIDNETGKNFEEARGQARACGEHWEGYFEWVEFFFSNFKSKIVINSEGETAHSTFKSTNRLAAEKQIREDPVVRYFLHKIYFFDYVVFPFKRDVLDPEYRSIFATAPAKVDIKFFV